MSKINLKALIQDEEELFQFIRENPQHGVVLGVLVGAIDHYHRVLPNVVRAHDLGKQQDMALIARFLKAEASDRVAIRSEHLMLNGVTHLLGRDAADQLLERQSCLIAEMMAQELAAKVGRVSMEHLFEKAGVSRVPTWGEERGKANVGPLLSLRLLRHEVFHLTREMHRAYHQSKRQESWKIKLQVEKRQADLGIYAKIAQKTCVRTMIKSTHSLEVADSVLRWVRTETRLAEYEAIRSKVLDSDFVGRIFSRHSERTRRRIDRRESVRAQN